MEISIFRFQVIFISCLFRNVLATQESIVPDFLQDHVPIYVTIVVGMFAFQTVVLLLMGQPSLPPSGLVYFYSDIHGPGTSQHLSDWYSFTHFLHGCIFYFITHGVTLWFSVPFITVNYCYLITLSSAVCWEFFENSSFGISRFNKTGAGETYNGDSVINSFSDSTVCSLGFWISYLSPWWIILLYGIAAEILVGIIARDNMTISAIQLFHSFNGINNWQKKGKNKQVTVPV